MTPEHTKLNIGCGFNKQEYFWNIDKDARCNPDQIVDIEQCPWPFETDFFERILANNVLTYVGDTAQQWIDIIKEMYRVSADQAEWVIKFPHHRCDWQYSDHAVKRPLSFYMFGLFDQTNNVASIERRSGDSVHGLLENIDIEVFDINTELLPYWQQQVQDQLVTPKQMDTNVHTLNNILQSVTIHCRVHKPGRHHNFLKSA